MDSIQHTVAGFAIGHYFQLPTEQCAVIAGFGLLPDAIGYAEKVYKRTDSWNWYNTAHDWETFGYGCIASLAFMLVLSSFVPIFGMGAYGLHLLLDKLTHGEGKRWWMWKERLWAEVLGWVLLVWYFL